MATGYCSGKKHGFPTKLGEYLASGNHTLVTSVCEIPDYLTVI